MKKPKIVEILNKNIFSKSEIQLKQLGFFYSKKEYISELDNKTFTIRLGQDFILFYDEEIDQLFLCFELDFESVISGYDKWYEENISKKDCERAILNFEYFHFYIKVNNTEYGPEDFHPGSKSIIIKDVNVEGKLKDQNYFEKFYEAIAYEELNTEKFIEVSKKFMNSEIDIKRLVEENYELSKFKFIPMYLKQNDWASKIFSENFENLINLYRNLNDKVEKENLYQYINTQKKIGEKFLNLKVELPD